ncbi:hypothetical protein [Nonomuraea diastatica]|uniref:Uncharacterized protein n=1 Tax=Nonomuraea diastatica TaxID=1848329 RepID=A0A4R4V3V8_9ACTN|nr:hypothetical protein [Nonomuraea diastatica]TDC99787.1 hypothetical protein E1294_52035 [Nonomuraea diastatica]
MTGLSATEVLLVAHSSPQKAGRVEVYDSARGMARVLADVPSPRPGYALQKVAVGDKHIVWFGATPNSTTRLGPTVPQP